MILKFNDEMQAIILNKEIAALLKQQEQIAKKREAEAIKQLQDEIQTNNHSLPDK